MRSNWLGSSRVRDRRSNIFLTNASINFVLTTILCCSVHNSPTTPEQNANTKLFTSSEFRSGGLDDRRYRYEHINQTISKPMRELIDNDETVQLRWDGVVVKWSRYGQYKARDHNSDGSRQKRSPRVETDTASKSSRFDCGRKARASNEKMHSIYTHSNPNTKTNISIGSHQQHNGNKRIYDGYLAKSGDFPWVAQIKIYRGKRMIPSSLCSGSIISEWLIMTSLHCVIDCVDGKTKIVDPSAISALIGRHDISWWELNIALADVWFRAMTLPLNVDACRLSVEQDQVYLVTTERMKLREKTSGNENLTPVCLPVSGDEIKLEDRKATLAGWGETTEGGGRSTELRWGEVTILRKDYCQKAQPDLDSNATLCAKSDARGGCRGDSGGPLMVKDQSSGRWIQVGIYSAYVGSIGKCGPDMLLLFAKNYQYWRYVIDSFDIKEYS